MTISRKWRQKVFNFKKAICTSPELTSLIVRDVYLGFRAKELLSTTFAFDLAELLLSIQCTNICSSSFCKDNFVIKRIFKELGFSLLMLCKYCILFHIPGGFYGYANAPKQKWRRLKALFLLKYFSFKKTLWFTRFNNMSLKRSSYIKNSAIAWI